MAEGLIGPPARHYLLESGEAEGRSGLLRNSIRGRTASQLRTLLDDGATAALADGELLERFASREGDPAEAAFAALVERHGPMVLRACRSILRDPHRARDAFQVTFLLLARRAGSLWVRDSIGPWLHSVACRTASGVRAAEARQAGLLRRAARASTPFVGGAGRDDLGSALHEEIERLPDRLRAPLVLCYLEGMTHDQAADHLGCPVGTVRSRLARGRDRLRRDLARRGFAPPADPPHPGLVPLPPATATLAIQAMRLATGRSTAATLTLRFSSLLEGVVRAMTIHPLKSAVAVLLASGAFAAGLGATLGQEPKVEAEKTRAQAGPPASRRSPEATEDRLESLAAESRSLRLRVEELERRLEAIDPVGKLARAARPDSRALHKVRPRFDNVLIEKIHVAVGQRVKQGDPLMIIRSAELGQARNECRTNYIQWDHDKKYLSAREPLAKDGRITQIVWTDTVNSEKQSRLSYRVAREKLAMFGMTDEKIDEMLELLGDDRKRPQATEDQTRMTLTSPVDGTVIEVDAEPDSFYDQRDVLVVIDPSRP